MSKLRELNPDVTLDACRIARGDSSEPNEHILVVIDRYAAYAEEVKALREKNLELFLLAESLQDKVDLYEEPYSMSLEECGEELGLTRLSRDDIHHQRLRVIRKRAVERMEP